MPTILKVPSFALSQLLEAAKPDFAPPPTLEQLALSAPNPLPLDDLALAVGVRPELLHRVSQGRQALPAQLVGPIAAALGVQPGEVAAAARSVSEAASKILPGMTFGPGAMNPLPPDRLLGDPIYFRPVASTVPPAFGG